MFRKKYAYTDLKHIDWDALKAEYDPQVADAEKNNDSAAFQRALKGFLWSTGALTCTSGIDRK